MVGLNIESGCLQAVAFAPGKKRIEDIAFLELDFEKNQETRLAEGLRELSLVPPLQYDREVCLSVGGDGVVVRYLTLQPSARESLEEMIKQSLESRLPFKSDQVHTDYQILGPGDKKGQVKVVLAAVQKTLAAEKINLALAAGLKVKAIETESIALINAWLANAQLLKEKTEDAVGLLHVGFDTSVFSVVLRQDPLLSRDIKFGVFTLIKTMAKNNGLKLSENLRLLKEASQSKEKAAPFLQWIKGDTDHLSEEVQISCEHFQNQFGKRPVKIYLTGQLKALPDISGIIPENLGVTVSAYNPFSNIILKPGLLDLVKNNEPAFALAAGLALHSDD
jgi:type IV pilus assembly protein PilM